MNPLLSNLIVVSGPTREWIDPVRFLSNPSSGNTGLHIAMNAKNYFNKITYISGPGKEKYRKVKGAKNIIVESVHEMYDAVHASITNSCLLIMAAAPADYYPKNLSLQKIKKKYALSLQIDLLPSPDILKSLIPIADSYDDFYRVGFAAETQNVIENAKKKLKKKELFLICANQVYREDIGFGNHNNSLIILDKQGKTHKIGPLPKDKIAVELLAVIVQAINSA